MTESWLAIYEWSKPLLIWFTSISLVLALVSIVVLPILIIYMPKDYFLGAHRRRRRGVSAAWLFVVRNFFAALLLIAGILMLLLPGQGVLTMLAAIILSDVPGKYRLERWLILRPGLLRAINWLRRKYGKLPLLAPPQGINRTTFGKRQQ